MNYKYIQFINLQQAQRQRHALDCMLMIMDAVAELRAASSDVNWISALIQFIFAYLLNEIQIKRSILCICCWSFIYTKESGKWMAQLINSDIWLTAYVAGRRGKQRFS